MRLRVVRATVVKEKAKFMSIVPIVKDMEKSTAAIVVVQGTETADIAPVEVFFAATAVMVAV